MLDAAVAPVILDALFERGVAELPGVGTFRFVARVDQRITSSALVHVFPERSLEFTVEPSVATALSNWMQEHGGDFTFPRLGVLHRNFSVTPDPTLTERMRNMPPQLFVTVTSPPPVAVARVTPLSTPVVPASDDRPWWRRLFGL